MSVVVRRLSLTLLFTGTALFMGAAVSGCVFRFSNAERAVDDLYRHIYIPSATDVGSRGGHAARVSQAVRRALALDTRFTLVPLSEARVAVDLQLGDVFRTTVRVEECKTGDEPLASGSIDKCRTLNSAGGAANLALPDASAEEETASADVRLRVVDLNTGKLLVNRRLERVNSGTYDLVGDSTVKAGLRSTPELHALRYAENADAAIDRIGAAVAAEVVSALLALDSNLTPTPAPVPSEPPAKVRVTPSGFGYPDAPASLTPTPTSSPIQVPEVQATRGVPPN